MPKQTTKITIEPAVEGKRRRYTPQHKRALLEEAARPGGSISTTARGWSRLGQGLGDSVDHRKRGTSPSLLFN